MVAALVVVVVVALVVVTLVVVVVALVVVPAISVLLPVKNAGPYLPRALSARGSTASAIRGSTRPGRSC